MPMRDTQFVRQRVLFAVAHPDDIEGLAGGLVLALRQQGTEVFYLIMTNGDKGGMCYNSSNVFFNCSKEALATLRRAEQVRENRHARLSGQAWSRAT
jgi:LmbE family N-acetylglucosaminyl deacetylase